MIFKQFRNETRDETGASLVEFSLVLLVLLTVIFALIDVSRLLLVYTTTANAARTGLRYAITHGAGRTGGGANGPSGPSANPANVVTVIQNYSTIGTLQTGLINTAVTYPDGTNTVGSRINVSVTYPYTPMVALYALTVNVGSTTQGTVTCCQ